MKKLNLLMVLMVFSATVGAQTLVKEVEPIKIGGYANLRYQSFQQEGKNDGFDFRRAYVELKSEINSNLSLKVQADVAGSPKLMDINLTWKIDDALSFTFGQQSVPLSLNNISSNTALELADRSQVVESLSSRKGDVLGDNNGRDIGITAQGSFLDVNGTNLIEYKIGVFNGSGINRTDFNDSKDVAGRIVLHPIKDLDLGGSMYYGWTSDSTTVNNGAAAANQYGLRERVGGEISYTWRNLNVKAEYLAGTDGNVKKSGYYAQLGMFAIEEKLQLVGRYDFYDKNSETSGNSVSNISVGGNYYFNKNLLLQAAYTIKTEESAQVDNNLLALQLQVKF